MRSAVAPDETEIALPVRCRTMGRRFKPTTMALVLSAVLTFAYVAYERVGTRANADTVEYTKNLAGGFLAVGNTNDQPGFVVFSELDQAQVDVSATQASSIAAGTHTIVKIVTPRQRWQARLRTPLVIIVRPDGSVMDQRVDWGLDEFTRIRAASDCSRGGKKGAQRCGAPFADLYDAVAAGRVTDVPDEVRAFLNRFQQD